MNIGNLTLKTGTIHDYLKEQSEGRWADDLAKAFRSEGVQINPKLINGIIDFTRMIKQCVVYKGHRSKRQAENDLAFRVGTIKRMVEQIRRDRNYFRSIEVDEGIKSLLFVALLEKASLIYEQFSKKDFRDNQALDFHLWVFRSILTEQEIRKPIETLAFILEKSRVLEKLNGNWKARTIFNKCASAQAMINQSKACHSPKLIGSWPKIGSLAFVKTISGECPKCYKAWSRTLLKKGGSMSPIDRAARNLKAEIPDCSELTDKIISSLRCKEVGTGMGLSEILQRLPADLGGVVYHLF